MLPNNKVMLIGFTKPGCDALQLLHSLLQNALLVFSACDHDLSGKTSAALVCAEAT